MNQQFKTVFSIRQLFEWITLYYVKKLHISTVYTHIKKGNIFYHFLYLNFSLWTFNYTTFREAIKLPPFSIDLPLYTFTQPPFLTSTI